MHKLEAVGEKNLFNGVNPRAWRLDGRYIYAQNQDEVDVMREMMKMGHLGKASAAILPTSAKLIYHTPEDAEAVYEELADPTVE